jgi:chaperonin GroEL
MPSIVPGGGVALLRCKNTLDEVNLKGDEKIGVSIIRRAIEEPIRQISENAGQEGSVIVQKALSEKTNVGYNAETDKFEDMIQAGIIDPTKVTRTALQNAASIAGLMLTTEALVSDMPEDVLRAI